MGGSFHGGILVNTIEVWCVSHPELRDSNEAEGGPVAVKFVDLYLVAGLMWFGTWRKNEFP